MKHIKRSMEPSTKYWFIHKHGSYMYIVNILLLQHIIRKEHITKKTRSSKIVIC